MSDRIVGLTWDEIVGRQQRRSHARTVDANKPGDYGSDPLPDGLFRMVPSGDIVNDAERARRLGR